MSETERRTLHIAPWGSRFWAWLVDVIVVGAVLNALWSAVGAVTIWSVSPFLLADLGELGGTNGLGLWLYWTLLEGYNGRSIGKLVLNLRVTDRAGEPVEYGAAAVESFGKAFLLPIDVLVGLIVYDEQKLRLFNRLSETIVIESDEELSEPANVEYVYPDD